MHNKLVNQQEVVRTLASSWTAEATHGVDGTLQQASFNNVTLPNFGLFAFHLSVLGRTDLLAIAPLLPSEKVTEFEEFAFKNQGWVSEDLAVAALKSATGEGNKTGDDNEVDVMRDENFLSAAVNTGHISRINNCTDPFDNSKMLIAPLWQMFPTPKHASESLIVHDLQCQEWFPPLLKQMLATRNGVFSPMLDPTVSTTTDDVQTILVHQHS
ncbi:hypothetical protein IV203_029544 [Nitzschia inconspicua]|uniref:Uncharacterized protein n=1 Tax=Nitzschia inconspicua TaxID=303405 RepID=A0A9K3LQT5_9STRA|nr:hypothetical protein IV203_029544 [Nitzschia inconspicua]